MRLRQHDRFCLVELVRSQPALVEEFFEAGDLGFLFLRAWYGKQYCSAHGTGWTHRAKGGTIGRNGARQRSMAMPNL